MRVLVKSLTADAATGRFRMEVVWHDSWEADEQRLDGRLAAAPACWMLVGYASGYASFCLGRDVFFIEQKCRAVGARACRAVGQDRASWGQEVEPLLACFQADDIQGQIRDLTRALKEKMREVERQRRQIDRLDSGKSTALVEVHSESFRQVVDLAHRAARYDSSVLITGDSGVGKELMARYIHRALPCASGPFLAVNCAALPETLLESELFGHRAGAFTGAVHDRVGLFEEANGGTLFLDEIGDISSTLQVKLLRALQEKEVLRVGDSRPRKVNVRILAATNRNLSEAIRASQFREDLFYRLGVIEIHIPPLRERTEDILPLARHFVKLLAKKLKLPGLRLDARCADYLQSYRWPGNIRELENAIERAAVVSHDGLITPECLPPIILLGRREPLDGYATELSLAEVQRRHILRVLEAARGNRQQAARMLGISNTTLWRTAQHWRGTDGKIGRQENERTATGGAARHWGRGIGWG